MSTPKENAYMEADSNLRDAVQTYIKAARGIGKADYSIADAVTDALYDSGMRYWKVIDDCPELGS